MSKKSIERALCFLGSAGFHLLYKETPVRVRPPETGFRALCGIEVPCQGYTDQGLRRPPRNLEFPDSENDEAAARGDLIGPLGLRKSRQRRRIPDATVPGGGHGLVGLDRALLANLVKLFTYVCLAASVGAAVYFISGIWSAMLLGVLGVSAAAAGFYLGHALFDLFGGEGEWQTLTATYPNDES